MRFISLYVILFSLNHERPPHLPFSQKCYWTNALIRLRTCVLCIDTYTILVPPLTTLNPFWLTKKGNKMYHSLSLLFGLWTSEHYNHVCMYITQKISEKISYYSQSCRFKKQGILYLQQGFNLCWISTGSSATLFTSWSMSPQFFCVWGAKIFV